MTQLSRHEERQAAVQILFAAAKQMPDEAELDQVYDLVVGDAEYDAFCPSW